MPHEDAFSTRHLPRVAPAIAAVAAVAALQSRPKPVSAQKVLQAGCKARWLRTASEEKQVRRWARKIAELLEEGMPSPYDGFEPLRGKI